ncbi:bile acid:sodium symporter family protein [Paucihalobacter ruber]|uniref:Bile acid:sodium symporter family protein n=1 Tax=Paucihalobacter ruber TaxID=2567861 RepID=A0A506PPU4_9FLAO|nr:bile acid:sodium symporter family protein [Paucihalobacter ruber]TPV35598.1 bile acid:sodium symporter family protein [Paucihalobacter ruber]
MNYANILFEVFFPVALAVIMLGMGMNLVPNDFIRIVKYPKAILIGLTNQFVFLPCISFFLAIACNLSPLMAIGLMILASCPGGPTSNLITQICKGNVALSVTLTSVASVISVLTIPYVLSFSLEYFGSKSDSTIKLPILDTIIQIFGITVLPISIGMVVRRFKTKFAIKMEKTMRLASTLIFIAVFMTAVAVNFNLIGQAMREVGLVTLLLNILTLGLGFLTAKLFKLNFKMAISISIESGIQNGTLAFVIATTILRNTEMSIPTVAYVIWMYIISGILMWKLSKSSY